MDSLKGFFFSIQIYAKRRIFIVSFLNYIPENNVRIQGNLKAEPHRKFATSTASPISYISLPSHNFFLDEVEDARALVLKVMEVEELVD